MEHSWKDITSDLYSKIKPIGGTLNSQIDQSFKSRRSIENFWLEFNMNDFSYFDPFYGEQKSTSPFKMTIELWDYMAQLEINSVFELENLVIEGGKEDRIGAFSNSLHFTVPKLKFGSIVNLTIEVEVEYSLTNSESYGMMNGTIKDHINERGKFLTDLSIKELQVLVPNNTEPLEIAKFLDNNIYEPKLIRLAEDLNWSSPNYKGYYVPYKIVKRDTKIWWHFN